MSLPETFQASELCDSAAGGWERSIVDVAGRDLMAIDVEAIGSLWDAERVRADLLPVVAFNMAVNLFEEAWSENTKRAWIANNWTFLSRRGNVSAMRMALGASGYDLMEYVAPPQGFYASPDLTPAQHRAWLALMPEIRITLGPKRGRDNGQWFAGVDFADDGFAAADDGRALFGRFGILRRNGVDIPLENVSIVRSERETIAEQHETMAVPGLSTFGIFADDIHADDDRFVNADETLAFLVNYRTKTRQIDVDYSITSEPIGIELQPIDVRPEISSDTGDAGLDWFCGDGFSDGNFVYEDNSAYMIAESVFLLDPAVQTLRVAGVSFAGVDRVGLPHKTVEVLVNLNTSERQPAWYVEDGFADEAFAIPADTSHVDRAIRAIEAARGLSQRVLASFQDKRPLAIRDPVYEGTLAGAWVRNSL